MDLNILNFFHAFGFAFIVCVVFSFFKYHKSITKLEQLLKNQIVKIITVIFLILIAINAFIAPHTFGGAPIQYARAILNWTMFLFHEGGHFICQYFGQTIHTLGGTFFEYFIPLGFCFYLFKSGNINTSFLIISFIGINLKNTSDYIATAEQKMITTLGGEGSHDWNHILSLFSLLEYHKTISSLCLILGILVFLLGISGLTSMSFLPKAAKN